MAKKSKTRRLHIQLSDHDENTLQTVRAILKQKTSARAIKQSLQAFEIMYNTIQDLEQQLNEQEELNQKSRRIINKFSHLLTNLK